MTKHNKIQIFSDRKVRTVWDSENEKWFFSVVDVVGALTDSENPATYWKVLKSRLKKEGNETVTNCSRLKLPAADGKMRMTDVADQQQLFRLIQSIPSPNAEPFKQWMAQVASNRIDQLQDPELSIEQAVADYRRLGYSEQWINQRIRSIETRKLLTDEWQRGGVEQRQYGLLTDFITQQWSGMKTREYKEHKGLHKENLRDNMTNVELALNILPKPLQPKYPNNRIRRRSVITSRLRKAEAMWQKPHATSWNRNLDALLFPLKRRATILPFRKMTNQRNSTDGFQPFAKNRDSATF